MSASRRREPVRKIEDHPREKASLSDSEQKAQAVKQPYGIHKNHRRRDYPPAHHNPSDPETRAEFLQQDVTGNLKQKIPKKEYPCADAVHAVADFGYINLHLQFSEPYVDAIKV